MTSRFQYANHIFQYYYNIVDYYTYIQFPKGTHTKWNPCWNFWKIRSLLSVGIIDIKQCLGCSWNELLFRKLQMKYFRFFLESKKAFIRQFSYLNLLYVLAVTTLALELIWMNETKKNRQKTTYVSIIWKQSEKHLL